MKLGCSTWKWRQQKASDNMLWSWQKQGRLIRAHCILHVGHFVWSPGEPSHSQTDINMKECSSLQGLLQVTSNLAVQDKLRGKPCLYNLMCFFLTSLSFSLSLRHFDTSITEVPEHTKGWIGLVSAKLIQEWLSLGRRLEFSLNCLHGQDTQLIKECSLAAGTFFLI